MEEALWPTQTSVQWVRVGALFLVRETGHSPPSKWIEKLSELLVRDLSLYGGCV
jgi:hypothetical protein